MLNSFTFRIKKYNYTTQGFFNAWTKKIAENLDEDFRVIQKKMWPVPKCPVLIQNMQLWACWVMKYCMLNVGGDKQHLKVPLNPALGNFAYLFILFFLCSTSFNLCVFSCEQGRILVHGLRTGFHCFRVINPFMFNANDNLLWHKLRNHSF